MEQFSLAAETLGYNSRVGYEGWLRNLAVALGNGPATNEAVTALQQRLGFSPLVDEHIHWALARLDSHR